MFRSDLLRDAARVLAATALVAALLCPALAGTTTFFKLDQDPQTVSPEVVAAPGLRTSLPPPGGPAPASPNLSHSNEGLRVERSRLPGGGEFVDLRGRFMATARAASSEVTP